MPAAGATEGVGIIPRFMQTKNIVILISGNGSNMLAIAQAAREQDWSGRFQARIAAVLSNQPDCVGLARAQDLGLATQAVDHRAYADAPEPRAAFDAALAAAVERHTPRLVVLAGFMRILTPAFVQRFAGRLVNFHPSLLPAFPGLRTHARAIAAGCTVAGATVHQVTEELDHGPILDQAVVPVLPGDDAASLGARVLAQEHLLYPRVIARLLEAH